MTTENTNSATTKENTNSAVNQRRAKLRELSNTVKAQMEAGEIKADNINDGLIEHYKQEASDVFLTMEQWSKVGYSVKKGATSVQVWGKPKTKNGDNGEEFTYHPLVYLFSNRMVHRSKRNQNSGTTAESQDQQ